MSGESARQFSVNPKYLDVDFQGVFLSQFSPSVNSNNSNSALNDYLLKDVKMMFNPFPCAVLPNFVECSSQDLHQLIQDSEKLAFKERINDLHQFAQTNDLKTCNLKSVQSIRELFFKSACPLLETITGLSLSKDSIDFTCSKYVDGDYLLCHDDRLARRRIAFVWYLVASDWSEADGGHFQMFSTDKDNSPNKIANSILPLKNSFVFFPVNDKSFHQVAEITSLDKIRLSFNGWFHYPVDTTDLSGDQVVSIRHNIDGIFVAPRSIDEDIVYKWINPQYLDMEIQKDIQKSFLEDSQIQLIDFLNESLYDDLLVEMKEKCGDLWSTIGPYNSRNVEKLKLDDLCDTSLIKEVVNLFLSDAFCVVLSDLTGLELYSMADHEVSGDDSSKRQKVEVLGKCGGCVRRWKPGCYSLLKDDDFGSRKIDSKKLTLDALWFVGCSGWRDCMGGSIHYCASDEQEPLLVLEPSENTLNLVCCEPGTASFVRYCNRRLKQMNSHAAFFDFCAAYMESSDVS